MIELTTTFFSGAAAGAILVVIVGFFVRQILVWIKTGASADKPQAVMHFTTKTPRQIQREATTANMRAAFFITLLLYTSIALVDGYFFDFAVCQWSYNQVDQLLVTQFSM